MKKLHIISVIIRICMISFGFILEAAGIALIFISMQLGKKFLVNTPLLDMHIDAKYIGIAFIGIGLVFQILSLMFLHTATKLRHLFMAKADGDHPERYPLGHGRQSYQEMPHFNGSMDATIDEKLPYAMQEMKHAPTPEIPVRQYNLYNAGKKRRTPHSYHDRKVFTPEIIALILTTTIIGMGFAFLFFSSNPIISRKNINTSIHSGKKFIDYLVDNRFFIFRKKTTPSDSASGFFTIPFKSNDEKGSNQQKYPSSQKTDQIIITSNPSGAMVFALERYLGTTPMTWNKPPVYGPITLSAEMNGYTSQTTNIEYQGGIISKHFALARRTGDDADTPNAYFYKHPLADNPSQRPDTAMQQPGIVTMTAESSAAIPTPATHPKTDTIVQTLVATKTAVSIASADSGTIFLSSLPPLAEIYLQGNKIGTTNANYVSLPTGTHLLTLVKGSNSMRETVTIRPGRNASRLIVFKNSVN